jgi:hypothetical protein
MFKKVPFHLLYKHGRYAKIKLFVTLCPMLPYPGKSFVVFLSPIRKIPGQYLD